MNDTTKEIKAVIRYADLNDWPNPPEDRGIACHPACAATAGEPKVGIIDLSDPEALVLQVSSAVRPELFSGDPDVAHRAASPFTVDSQRERVNVCTRLALRSIGLLP